MQKIYKRLLFLVLLLNLSHAVCGNERIAVYLFPGQGSDERIFSKINLDSNYQVINIVYPVPEKGTTMTEFAHLISNQIDTNGKYIFIGVSLGGMICTELADFLKPEMIIIISSATCREELPFRYTFQKIIPLYKIVPKGMIKVGAQILQPIVEPDRKKEKAIFKSMLKNKSPLYYKRTVDMIINWDRVNPNEKIIHIHGTKDHTIPIRNVHANYKIDKGSHMITLTRGVEINGLIKSILEHHK